MWHGLSQGYCTTSGPVNRLFQGCDLLTTDRRRLGTKPRDGPLIQKNPTGVIYWTPECEGVCRSDSRGSDVTRLKDTLCERGGLPKHLWAVSVGPRGASDRQVSAVKEASPLSLTCLLLPPLPSHRPPRRNKPPLTAASLRWAEVWSLFRAAVGVPLLTLGAGGIPTQRWWLVISERLWQIALWSHLS